MRKILPVLLLCVSAGCAGVVTSVNEAPTSVNEALCVEKGYCSNSSYSGKELVDRVMFSANYSNSNLGGVDLSSKNMFMTDFSNSNLQGAVFANANLSWANFYGADITGADFTGALLSYANFDNVKAGGTKFDNTVGSSTIISDTVMRNSSWKGSVIIVDKTPNYLPKDALVCSPVCVVPTSIVPDTAAPMLIKDYIEQDKAVNQVISTYRLSPTVVSRLYGYSGETVIETLSRGYSQIAAVAATLTVVSEILPDAVNDQTVLNSRDYALWVSTLKAPSRRQAAYRDARNVADYIVTKAAADGFTDRVKTYTPGKETDWKPTPPAFNPPTEPGWGSLKTFKVGSSGCKVGAPDYDINKEAAYVYDLSQKLSDDQQNAARFWDDGRGRTSTPVGHWHTAGVFLLAADALDGSKSVESIMINVAYIDMAMADTMIKVWEGKYLYKTQRVATTIQETDPSWRPYIINPPFPSWPSGHAAISATASTLLHSIIGDLSYVDPGWGSNRTSLKMLNVQPRRFDNVLSAGKEAGMSRVWGGIHIMPDYYEGVDVGKCIATEYSKHLVTS